MRLAAPAVMMAIASTPISASPADVLETILQAHPGWFGAVLAEADRHRLQILYTQIDRDARNRPTFTSHGLRLDDGRYFYPASTVKLPVAVLALEKLARLDVPEIDRDTFVRIGSGPSAHEGTVGRWVEEIFLVSDNDAFNRLYELLGQRYINETLWAKGFEDVRILRRLETAMGPDENRVTPPFELRAGKRVLHRQPGLENPHRWRLELGDVRQGIGHVRDGELVPEPIDFSHSNYLSLASLQGILRSVLFPGAVPEPQRFELTDDDRRFLYRVMSMLPRESEEPRYDPAEYHDSYGKYFLFGDSKEPIPEHIRIFNKVGQAYGYLLDNAYVVDFDAKVEFLLTAVIQVNENRIMGDDRYEYEEIGIPFLANLGRAVYAYELERERAHAPDLSRFRVHGLRQQP